MNILPVILILYILSEMADMFKWKGSRHNEAVRTIFESYYGQYWVEWPAAAEQDSQTSHVPAE